MSPEKKTGRRARRPAEAPKRKTVAELRALAREAIERKLAEGKKLTAADYEFLRAQERTRRAPVDEPKELEGELEELLEEWVERDGVVDGVARGLEEFGERGEVAKALVKAQRRLLRRYGFEGTRTTGELSGAERQALQWVKSIAQLDAASREWWLQFQQIQRQRKAGSQVGLEDFQAIAQTVKQLSDRRDTLILRVRDLASRERRSAGAAGKARAGLQIVVKDLVE